MKLNPGDSVKFIGNWSKYPYSILSITNKDVGTVDLVTRKIVWGTSKTIVEVTFSDKGENNVEFYIKDLKRVKLSLSGSNYRQKDKIDILPSLKEGDS